MGPSWFEESIFQAEEEIWRQQRERTNQQRRAKYNPPPEPDMPPITINTPFVRYDLPEQNLILMEKDMILISSAEWRLIEKAMERHVRETTQEIEVFDDQRGFNRRIISVQALTIWLIKGTETLEERLLNGFGLKLPHVPLMRNA